MPLRDRAAYMRQWRADRRRAAAQPARPSTHAACDLEIARLRHALAECQAAEDMRRAFDG